MIEHYFYDGQGNRYIGPLTETEVEVLVERLFGPRYCEAITGARQMRERAIPGRWYRRAPFVIGQERALGIPQGWATR